MTKIYARNMIEAQGFQLTDEIRAELTAKANRFREITGTTELTKINILVFNHYQRDMVMGQLSFML